MKAIIVNKEQANNLRKEGIKTLVAVTVVSLLIGGAIGYFIGGGKLPEVPEQNPCQWAKCYCNSGYDYHCVTHGNGHECYDDIASID